MIVIVISKGSPSDLPYHHSYQQPFDLPPPPSPITPLLIYPPITPPPPFTINQADEDRWGLYYGVKAMAKDDAEAQVFWGLLDEAHGEDGQQFLFHCLSIALSLGGAQLWYQLGWPLFQVCHHPITHPITHVRTPPQTQPLTLF